MLPCLWTSLIISSQSSGGQNCNGGGGRAGRKDLWEEGAFGALDACNFSCICCGITILTGSALGLTIGRGGSAGFDFGPDLFCLPNHCRQGACTQAHIEGRKWIDGKHSAFWLG